MRKAISLLLSLLMVLTLCPLTVFAETEPVDVGQELVAESAEKAPAETPVKDEASAKDKTLVKEEETPVKDEAPVKEETPAKEEKPDEEETPDKEEPRSFRIVFKGMPEGATITIYEKSDKADFDYEKDGVVVATSFSVVLKAGSYHYVVKAPGFNALEKNLTVSDEKTVAVEMTPVVAEGEVTEGEVTEGEVTEGEITEGEVTEGEVTEGEVTEGEVTEGEVTEGEVTEGEVTEGEDTEGEDTEDEDVEGEDTEDEDTEGEDTEDEDVEGEDTENEDVEDEDAEDEDVAGIFTVTFMDGEEVFAEVELTAGEALGEKLPAFTDDPAYIFEGWFAEDAEVTAETVPEADLTAAAKYTYMPASGNEVWENDQAKVTFSWDAGVFPEGVVYNITVLSQDRAKELVSQAVGEDQVVVDAFAVDITFSAEIDGQLVEDLQPRNGAGVHVKIELKETLEGDEFIAVHEDGETGVVSEVDGSATAEGMEFTGTGFSEYGVGGTRSAALSDIYVQYNGTGSITVTFDPNGGEGNMSQQTLEPSSTSQALYANTFTREGYNFIGWGLNDPYPTRVYGSGATIAAEESFTLYAIWDDAPAGYTNVFASAMYGSFVQVESDGNDGWVITGMNTWGPGQYGENDPGSPTKIYIPATYQGKPITAIGASAFHSKGLTGLVINPNMQLKTIGSSAFSGNSISGALPLPVTLETIGSYAFSSNKISSVNFTELVNVRTIGQSAFSGNYIASVDLSNMTLLTTITQSSFYMNGGYGPKNPVLPPNVTKIEGSAFAYATGTVVIPDSVTSITGQPFYLTGGIRVDISGLSDEKCASFYTSLLPRDYDARGSITIVFPDSWYTADSTGTFVIYNNRIYGVQESWAGGVLTVPADVPATSLAISAFATKPAASKITGLVFEEGCPITAIPDNLCIQAPKLTSVTLHSGATTIGEGAFSYCNKLTSVSLANVTSIGNSAFYEDGGLTSVTIPASVSHVGTNVFAYCTGLTTVTIGASAENGGTAISGTGHFGTASSPSVFYFDGNLTDIYVPGVTEGVGTTTAPWSRYPWGATDAVVHWADGDSSSTYKDYVDDAGNHWLYRNGTLVSFLYQEKEDGTKNYGYSSSDRVSLTIPTAVYDPNDTEHTPHQVSTLASYLLPDRGGKNRYFGAVTVPGSFETVGSYVLARSTRMGNVSISSLTFEEGVKALGSHVCYCLGVGQVYLPDSIETIGTHAFAWASITRINLPEGLKTIGGSAFYDCSGFLGSRGEEDGTLVIPSTVTSIGSSALTGCRKLNKLMIQQYLNPDSRPKINGEYVGAVAPSSWDGNNFGCTYLGNRIYFLDGATTEVEVVETIVHSNIVDPTNPLYQTTTVIARAKKSSPPVELIDPYLTARSDDDIVEYKVIAPGSDDWETDFDEDWIYVELTVKADKTYYFDGTFYNSDVDITTVSALPITVTNNYSTLTYDRNSGSGSIPEAVEKLTGTTIVLEAVPADLVRQGYMANGWNTEAEDYENGTHYDGGAEFPLDGDYTLYVEWIPDSTKTYVVTYRSASTALGSVSITRNPTDESVTGIQVLSTEGVTGSTATVSATGHHFTGWFKEGVATPVSTSPELTAAIVIANLNTWAGTSNVYTDTQFTAGFAPNEYTIVFNANGGGGTMGNQTITYGKTPSDTLTANEFSKADSVFLGWATSQANANAGTVKYTDEAPFGDAELAELGLVDDDGATITLYAVWQEHYTVHFNGNGSTDDPMADQTINYGEATALSTNTYTRAGYQFAGWATSASGDVLYSDGETVTDIVADGENEITLYAKWDAEVEVFLTGSTLSGQTYNGTEQSNSSYTVTYKIAGADATALPDGITLAVTAVQDGQPITTIAATGTDAGTYTAAVTATISGTAAGYVIKTATATANLVLEITAREMTVEIEGATASLTYNGTTQSLTGSFTATSDDTLFDETKVILFSRSAEKVSGIDVGVYERGWTKDDFRYVGADGSAVDPNFDVTFEIAQDLTLTITKAPLTITVNNQTYTYNGKAQGEDGSRPYTTGLDQKVAVRGLQGSDALSSITLKGQETDAGEYKDKIEASSGAVTFGHETDKTINDNYDVTYVPGKLTIKPREMKILIYGAQETLPYNGEDQELRGFEAKCSDELFDETLVACNAIKPAVHGQNVDVYPRNWEDTDFLYDANSKNYKAVFIIEQDLILTIAAREVTINVTLSNDTQVYTGEEQHLIADFTYETEDTVLKAEAAFPPAYSGTKTHYHISRTDVGVTDTTVMDDVNEYFFGTTPEEDALMRRNFAFTINVNQGYLEITKAELTIVTDIKSKTYGEKDPELTVTVTGLADGETIPAGFLTISRDPGEDVGTYAIHVAGPASNGAKMSANAAGQSESVRVVKLSSNATATKAFNADNYDITYKNSGALTIEPRTVTLTSESGEKVYDGTAMTKPTVTVGGDGFVDGEVTGLKATGSVTYVTEGEVTNTITYTEGAGFKAENYTLTKVEGKLKITPTSLTITAKDQTYTYNGKAQGPEGTYASNLDTYVTVAGLVGSDKLTSVTLTGKEKAAGEYAGKIVPSAAAIGDLTANYEITYVPGKLTIQKEKDDSPATGDNTKIVLWASLMLTSAFGCAGALLLAAKKRRTWR